MVNCAACTKSIRSTSSGQQLLCSKCPNTYHAMCVNQADPRKLSEDFKSNWVCPLCHSKEPKKDNSNTPIRVVPAASDELRTNVIPREGRKLIATPPCSSPAIAAKDADILSTIAAELKLLREDIGGLKLEMKSFIEHATKRLDEHDTKILALEKRENEWLTEIAGLKTSLSQLQDQINMNAQNNLKNEIEVAGITETKGENLMHIIRVTAQKIGVTIDDCDLDYATRVGPRRSASETDTTLSTATPKTPRPLVVRFVRRQKRDEFLKAAKSRRNLSSEDIGIEGITKKLYFNERLTQDNRYLFRMVRQRSKEANFKYCWTQNGTIHIRKQEGTPAIAIRSKDDFARHLDSLLPQ